RSPVAPGPFHSSPQAGGLGLQGDVLGYRQVGKQRRVLIYSRDAQQFGAQRGVDGNWAVIYFPGPGGGLECACDDLDQSRLAGAVLADEPMNLSSSKLKARAPQRVHAGKRL